MKIAISAIGETLESDIAEVFGRCPFFIIAEIEGGVIKKTEAVKNESDSQQSGVGMAAAKLVVERGAEVVIAKNVGPRALDILRQFKVEVFIGGGTAKDSLRQYINKK